MAIGCAPKVAKLILIIFNLLFWLSGLILIIVGSVYLSRGTISSLDTVINTSTNHNILIGFIVVGSIIFVIGFCGCCGAIKESRCLLAGYIIFLVLIIIAEVAFGIIAIFKRREVEEAVTTGLKQRIMEHYGTNDTTVDSAVDGVQKELRCCGVDSPNDWKQSAWFKSIKNSQQVPDSCNDKPGNSLNSTFTEGCKEKTKQFAEKYLLSIIGVALGIAFFEIFVVICAFCLCRNTDIHSQSV